LSWGRILRDKIANADAGRSIDEFSLDAGAGASYVGFTFDRVNGFRTAWSS
jgi:hypothetical protein